MNITIKTLLQLGCDQNWDMATNDKGGLSMSYEEDSLGNLSQETVDLSCPKRKFKPLQEKQVIERKNIKLSWTKDTLKEL